MFSRRRSREKSNNYCKRTNVVKLRPPHSGSHRPDRTGSEPPLLMLTDGNAPHRPMKTPADHLTLDFVKVFELSSTDVLQKCHRRIFSITAARLHPGGFWWESEDLGDPEQPEDPEQLDHLRHPEQPEEPTSGDTCDQCEALSGQSPRHQEGSW